MLTGYKSARDSATRGDGLRCMSMIPTRLLLTMFLAAAAALAAGDHAAHALDATLPGECSDQQVAPVSVVILCGDAGVIAHDLVWHDWGAARSSASGTASVNTCDPSCAAGNREEHAIVVVADRLVDCTYGRPQYTRITYSLPDRSPGSPGSGAAEERSVSFDCPKRPHADPRIRTMRSSLTHHRAAGGRNVVRTRLALNVCAVRGNLLVVIKETRRRGRRTLHAHRQTREFSQTKRCQWHAVSWKPRPELLAAGAYHVAATVWDDDGQGSKTVSRRITTTD
jgi:hypothetical protein